MGGNVAWFEAAAWRPAEMSLRLRAALPAAGRRRSLDQAVGAGVDVRRNVLDLLRGENVLEPDHLRRVQRQRRRQAVLDGRLDDRIRGVQLVEIRTEDAVRDLVAGRSQRVA